MDKKIAIMTWHAYDNYGGVLQTYALRQAIISLGYHKVDVINYAKKPPKGKINPYNIKVKLIMKKKDIKKTHKEREKKFNSFRTQYLTYTQSCNDATDLFLLNDKYDKFICGSDQIWAPTLFNENYFLSFVNNDSKKISYAPSIGLPSIENAYIKEKIKELVNKIGSISIREEQGKEILEELTDKNIEVVLDPTFLLSKENWVEKFKLRNINKSDYIVFYCLGTNKKNLNIAKKFSKEMNKKLIIIPGNILDYKKKNIEIVSPDKFLELIYNAHMVITDSFHGTIFSIIFNIPFITLKRFKDNRLSQNSRIYNILKKVNLEHRIYDNNYEYFIKNMSIDFKEANIMIEKEKQKSVNFLKESLEKETENTIDFNKVTNLCSGCGVCVQVCPQNCITLKLNDSGFYHYEIDKEKCIKCNKCKNVCGQRNNIIKDLKKMKLYSAYSLDENVLKKSSSGGIAYEISKHALQKNIPVIGCSYDLKNNRAEHIIVTNEEELIKLSGSKYLQSYTVDAFTKINKLNEGIIIGTPCQIGSIDRYLNSINKRNKFILIDLICHGVPSYYLWKKYISKYKKIKNVIFRDKKYGWRSMTMSINSKYHKNEEKDLFYDLFRTEVVFNKSCYECKYRERTNADIRLGDYWGPKFEKEKTGVSMVVVCTETGEKICKELVNNKKIKMEEQLMEEYFIIQQTQNINMPLLYDKIISELKDKKYSLKKISKRYCKKDLRYYKILRMFRKFYYKIKGE